MLDKGAGNQSSVGVLVERTSRLVLLAKMEDATAESALAGFSAKLNSIIAPLRQSFTYDQGKEMSRHKELAAATGVNIYFYGVSRTQARACDAVTEMGEGLLKSACRSRLLMSTQN